MAPRWTHSRQELAGEFSGFHGPFFLVLLLFPSFRRPASHSGLLPASAQTPTLLPPPEASPSVCAAPLLRLSSRGHCGPCLPFPARESRTPPHAHPQADTAAAPCPARVLCTRPSTRCSHVIFSTNPSSLSDR